MKTVLVRSLTLALVLSASNWLWAQTATPFGTPSLLPIQDHYANWQSTAADSQQRAVPVSTRPGNYRQVPAPPSYYRSPDVPAHYAAARMQTRAVPEVPHSQSVVHPQTQTESVLPESSQAGPQMYGNSMSDCDDGYCWGESVCEPCYEPCCEPCGPCFYASVGGLFFTRNRPRFSQVSYDDTNLVGQVLSTDSGTGRWDAGAIAQFGWYLSPCCALEMTYWGVFGDQVDTTVYAASLAGNLNSAFDFSPLNIGATNVNDLFDAAQVHRVRRDYDVQNVELNLLSGRVLGMNCGGFQVSYLGGFRYLQFSEDFNYASADANPTFGVDPANEAFYDIHVRNNLWGFQLGGRADWFVTPRFSLYAAPKFGLYANYMEHHSRIYNANGSAVVGPGNPLVGGVFDIESDKTITSFIGEFDLGLSYQFTSCLGASLGYRALAVSGLAYATDQIPSHFADLPGVAMIDSNADMILHGGYAAVTLTW